ncbi:signal transduction histidine kinase [Amycolatopsis lexingtonensis]|uniref:histidine kinase n=1 Tax=Amycolatopsis lexingtonensis TaxID=218822 RepID=A0ABR9IBQ7_9PSEU|nr:ATP-binding protein [Amycolatopsis lexingtonensis]MBE1500606.1 signal transduction histidine kinase [Amycolatopsis lexingtonensis]
MNGFSVRAKLTAWYGALFLLAGLVLVVINYLLVQSTLPDPTRVASTTIGSADLTYGVPADAALPSSGVAARLLTGSLADYRSSTLSTLLVGSGIALVATAGLAVLFGWLMAGRALRPLHDITSTARRLEAGKLDRRINLEGPPDELKELADTFDGMLDRLAESFDSQKRFVANASHELRTPLAVQRTLIEVAMADPEVTPELRKLGTHLLHTNERSERMIEGLLVLARSDRGLHARAPVRLDAVVASVVRATAAAASEAGVTVETRLRPRVVAGDPVLLERLVTNLVVNAITYNASGGWVYVEVRGDPALEVRNSGPVVPPDAVPTLFEPFRRVGSERTGDTRNAGLGLSIVRSVTQAHGGYTEAQPGRRGGLTVTVRLPPS